MRILEVILAPMIGGVETLVAGLSQEWRKAGHFVDIVALDAAPNGEQERNANVLFDDEIAVLATNCSFSSARRIARLRGLRNAIRGRNYDVIHAHSHIPNMYCRLAVIGLHHRPRVVTTLHSASTSSDYCSVSQRVAERVFTPFTHAVVAVSRESAEEYVELFPSMEEKIHVIPNGIRFSGCPDRAAVETPKNFIAVGRISPQKDLKTLVVGFDKYAAQVDHEVSLRIVGPVVDDIYWHELQLVVADLAHADAISFLGGRTDVDDLLRAADVFVHAAVAENHPIAIIEAAGQALPVVAPDLTAIRQILGNEAYYFEPRSPSNLLAALHLLSVEWSAAFRISMATSKSIRDLYSIVTCAGAYIALFEQVVESSCE